MYSSWFTKDWESTKIKCAIYQSIGHELGHLSLTKTINSILDDQIISNIQFFQNKKWLNECYCDAFGLKFAQLCFNKLTYPEIIEFINYKFIYNAKTRKKDRHKYSHPSWSYRLQILNKHSNFSKDTLEKIANDFELFKTHK